MDKDQRSHWDGVFKGAGDYFGPEPSEFGRSALATFQRAGAKEVLELGCGQGRDTWLFARAGCTVTALDYSESGICQMRERATKLCLEPNVKCLVQDVRSGIPMSDGSVDAVYSHMFFTMELWEMDIAFILEECRRVLRPGGLNIFSVRNDHDPHFQKGVHKGEDMWQSPAGFVVHFFSEEKIRRLAKGYEVVSIVEFDDPAKQYTRKLYDVSLRKP
ncbi:MAG: class I SAM-dependent methyltransferase [Methanomassiliicoccales archaeon]|nr:class I SAM-dependent methyltransferase [Methanomassiliicoccales archaeon]